MQGDGIHVHTQTIDEGSCMCVWCGQRFGAAAAAAQHIARIGFLQRSIHTLYDTVRKVTWIRITRSLWTEQGFCFAVDRRFVIGDMQYCDNVLNCVDHRT